MLSVQTIPFIQEISSSWITKGCRLFIRREDVIHDFVSGNKWRKLENNLIAARDQGADTLVTFGGAYSNHIHATAAAAKETGFHSVGIIRGEESSAANATLSFARDMGMELIFVSRQRYRDKARLQEELKGRWPLAFFLPEGGTNCLAVKGCRKIIDEYMRKMDIVTVPVGTGGTMAGIISAMPGEKLVMGFSALKGDSIGSEVGNLLDQCQVESRCRWEVVTDAHCGGYARITDPLINFIRTFYQEHHILLDPVYTGKMMFGIKKRMEAGAFSPGTAICAVHTGGLQGWQGMYERHGIERPD